MQKKTTRLVVGLVAAAIFGLAASPASALVIRPNIYSFGTDGEEAVPVVGPFFGAPGDIDFHAPDRLYLTNASGEGTPNGIYGFDPSSVFERVSPFEPLATDAPGGSPGLAVDQSGGPSDGNVYFASQSTDKIYAFDSAGNALWTVDPRITPGAPEGKTSSGSLDVRGIAVDTEGTVWVSNLTTHYLLKYDSTGAYLGAVNVAQLNTRGSFTTGNATYLEFDSANNMYLVIQSDALFKLTPPAYDQETATVFEGGLNPYPQNVTVNRENDHVFTTRTNSLREYDSSGSLISEFGTNVKYGNLTESFSVTGYRGMAVNPATDQVYATDSPFGGGAEKVVRVFGPVGIVPDVTTGEKVEATRTTIKVKGHVELDGGGNITNCHVQAGTVQNFSPERSGYYDVGTFPCEQALPITEDGDVTATIEGVEPEDGCEPGPSTCKRQRIYYRFVASNETGPDTGAHLYAYPEPAIKDIDTLPATNVGLESVELNGKFDRDGYETHYYFQWTTQYNEFQGYAQYNNIQQSAAAPGPVAGSDEVHFSIPEGLEHGKTYYYRVVGINEFGITYGDDETFYTSSAPDLSDDIYVSDVSTDQGTIHLTGNPNGLATSYHIEYGTEGDCALNTCISLPEIPIFLGAGIDDAENKFELTGLEPDTTYHYRVVMSNAKGTVTNSTDHTFTTFANTVLPPPCPNDLARQQTGAALLLDCRAFELVSAANTGGYDVESSLAPGQEPYGGYPNASNPSQVLYGIHDGAIPGVEGNPTNKGLDPYVATRGEDGWTTKYVGIPANGTPSTAPFSSSLLAADPGLDTFAFGGPDLCTPCFDNDATGIPMRLPDGSLVQGMAGDNDPGASAAPDGLVTKAFSGDGSHFVFGSLQPYKSDGNNNTGDVSIYDRNLKTGETQVVSKTPGGTNLPCMQGAGECHSPGNTNGIAQLDISHDGSRIVVGQLVSEDAAGNNQFHLYMHIGNDSHTVDLTPGTTTGTHFDGMTADGSAVYFTTRDALSTASDQDTDGSVDLFRASVDESGTMELTRVSTGTGLENGSGNYDGCTPSGDSKSPDDWNTVSGGPTDCSVVPVGGGGGVASSDGTVYFLSPERLDGEGEDGSPNLFVVRPGSTPKFVTTLASNANHPFAPERHLLDYEITGFAIPSGAAYDHATGGFYVLDNSWRYPNFQENEPPSFVQKFDASGNLDQSFGTAGKIDGSESPTGYFRELGKISGNAQWAAPDSLAVDNTCADQNLSGAACASFDPSNGDLYVPDRGNNVVDKFDSNGSYISQIDVTEIVGNINVQVNGVEVDSNTGNVFVEVTGGSGGGGVLIFDNVVANAYTGTKFATNAIGNASDMAIDAAGNVYLTTASFSGSPYVRKYAPPYSNTFTVFAGNGVSGLAYDPISDHIFADKGDHVEEYTTEGVQVGPSFGYETLEESYSLDAYNERLVVSNKGPSHSDGKFSIFTPPGIPPDKRHDDSLVIDSVTDGDTRHTEDFQLTSDGRVAAFGSALPLASYEPEGHSEVYRYDEPTSSLICVSCPPTNAAATGDSTLAENGLNLTDDGRMFFTATEPLVLRDTNGKADVYEWRDGEIQPISPGQDQFGSKLLTVSADGKDAYFFTHATLAPQDRSGSNAKIYDAREYGGFFRVPPQPPCVASDECHGPGTQAAPPPDIGSFGGTPSQASARSRPRCRKGKVRRRGRCVRRHRSQRKRRHRRHPTRKRG